MNHLVNIITLTLISTFSFHSTQNLKPNSIARKSETMVENLDGSITIQGRVTVKGTETPPLGITTMNVANKWITKLDNQIIHGENQHVYIDKKGYYNITIQKGDDLTLIPNQYLYKDFKNYSYTNLQLSQVLNIQVEPDLEKLTNLEKKSPFIVQNLRKHLEEADTDSLIKIAGRIYNRKNNKPLQKVVVSPSFLLNTKNIASYHLTDKKGQFFLVVPKNKEIIINPLSTQHSISFSAKQDTIVDIYLNI